jgi:protease PrsW
MFCPACGSKVESGASFCRLCGRQLGPAKPAVPANGAPASSSVTVKNVGTAVQTESATAHLHRSVHLVQSLEDRLRRLAGTEKLEGFSVSEMFSEVFKRHTPAELDDYFVTGTSRTTPRIEDVQAGWPKPWFFFRVLVFVVLIYMGFDYMIQEFGNTKAIPGLLFMGSLAIPLTVVVLFFELNVTRDVSFMGVLALFASGTVIGFLFTEFLSTALASSLSWMGASLAGIVEEIAKLLAVCVIVGRRKNRFILNGVLFGAAVGAGFAVFESMGYAFDAFRNAFAGAMLTDIYKMPHYLVNGSQFFKVDDFMNYVKNVLSGNIQADNSAFLNMVGSIRIRAFLSPFGHVPWTAIAAGGLWRIKGNRDLEMRMFFQPQFLRIFAIPVTLHMIWDLPWKQIESHFWAQPPDWPTYVAYLFLGVVGWFVVMGLVQQGLHQVKAEQIAHTKLALERVQTGTVAGGTDPVAAAIH